MRRAARRWLRRLLLLAIVALLAGLGLRWLLQPERLGALLLQQAAAATGLRLEVATPARLGFWPGLHLELDGLTARHGDDAPLLRVDSAELFLPLSALWEPLRVRHVALAAPRLDLAALARWRAADMGDGPPAPATIPAIVRLEIRDGALVDGDWRLDGLQVTLSNLLPGARATLHGELRLPLGGEARPVSLELDGVRDDAASGLRLDPLTVQLGITQQPRLLDLAGRLWWDAPQRFDVALSGRLGVLPADTPAWLSAFGDADITLQHTGPVDFSAPLQLRVAAAGRGIDASARIPALLDWISAADWGREPPLQLRVEIPQLDIEGLRIEDLRIEHLPDATDAAD